MNIAADLKYATKRGLIVLLTGVSTVMSASSFELKAASTQWFVVNDSVMGGVSNSTARVVGGVLEFSGRVRLDNNGGFASVRSNTGRYNLESATGLTLRVRTE